MASPRGSGSWACPATTLGGERCTLAHVDSKKRRYVCNEIKLPVKETQLPVTGTIALQDVRRHSQSNEEDR